MAKNDHAAITTRDDPQRDDVDPSRDPKVTHVAPNDVESLYSDADFKDGDIKRKQVRSFDVEGILRLTCRRSLRVGLFSGVNFVLTLR